MGGLHRLLHHGHQLLAQLSQVKLIAQRSTEGLDDFGCIILAPVEATIDEGLDPSAQRIEQRGDHEGRAQDQQGIIPCLPGQGMCEGLPGEYEDHVKVWLLPQ